jgi:N-acetylglucosamine kinase-like BadF-type ATPase
MGIDLGGTSTRAELVDGAGEVLGVGVAEGANLRSAGSGIPGAARAVRRAAELALAEGGRARDAERVFPSEGTPEAKETLAEAGGDGPAARAGSRQCLPEVIVVAASGAGAARHQEVASAFREALAGICDRVHVENDLAAAFRSASSGGDGYLLLSGTGAVAARYRNGLLERRADGLGWILGDAGSGLWIGWQGLRAAAADLDGRGPRTELTARITEALEVPAVTGDPCQDLVRRVDELAPAQMGGLAPLVLASAGTDEVAAGIARRAGRALLTSLDAVMADGADRDPASAGREPIPADRELVLAGGILAHPTPVRDAVVTELEKRGGWRVVTAADPVVGTLRIARELAG